MPFTTSDAESESLAALFEARRASAVRTAIRDESSGQVALPFAGEP
jgi:hypothetical protein